MTNVILIENAKVEKGKVILVPFAIIVLYCLVIQGSIPMRYHIETDWGSRWFRFEIASPILFISGGSRSLCSLSQWTAVIWF